MLNQYEAVRNDNVRAVAETTNQNHSFSFEAAGKVSADLVKIDNPRYPQKKDSSFSVSLCCL